MSRQLSREELDQRRETVKRAWAKEASRYDKEIGFFEKYLFGEHRKWACSQASGRTLEVAVGTGLNLPFYPPGADVVGLDLSPEMLAIARNRVAELGLNAELREGDALQMPFEDGEFDSVVCTYSLCNIPDEGMAVAEMKRVLKPGGRLVLVDHIRSSVAPLYWLQKAIELGSRRKGEFMTRRPSEQVAAANFAFEERDRMRAGIVERLVATKLP